MIIRMSNAKVVAYRGKGVRDVAWELNFGNRFPTSSTFLLISNANTGIMAGTAKMIMRWNL